jgi:sec-independent protein translocase protein TatA
MIPTTVLQIGIPGGPELLIILLIAVLLFGANKLPKLARSSGQAMGEFQKGREEINDELEQMREGPSSSSGSNADPTEADTTVDADSGATPTNAQSTGPETDTNSNTETATES